MNHAEHGTIAMSTVTDGNESKLPLADLSITLDDDAITVPPLTAGTHIIAVTNNGTVPHEMNTGGVPIGTDLSRGDEIGVWMERGQVVRRRRDAVILPEQPTNQWSPTSWHVSDFVFGARALAEHALREFSQRRVLIIAIDTLAASSR